MFIITGAAGFIGSVLAHELHKNHPNTPLAAVDFLKTNDNRWDHLSSLPLAHKINPTDLFSFLENAPNVKAIFHMGANSDTSASEEDAKKWNLDYSIRLAQWCAAQNIPLIYASSAATYGNGEHGYTDDDSIDFLNKLAPLNHYGRSKNDFDKWLVQAENKPPQWVGLKFFNVYGPQEDHKGRMASVVRHGFNQISENNAIKLFESHKEGIAHGEQKRDFVYVKDVCRAMLWFYENPKISGLFNQGTGQARSFLDLAKATFAAMDKPENISFIPTPEKFRAHYQYFTQADMSKFNKVTGNSFTFTSLEDGVADYVKNYLLKGK